MRVLNSVIPVLAMAALAGCGNPGGISDEHYEKYKALAAPKILYSCTGDGMLSIDQKVGYVAGVGFGATYNKMLGEIEDDCKSKSGKLKVLASEK